ncbi:helix-turn-helix domain-containing protein [Fictibacillus fluitans]|uniref:AraC family transcriptional regulator n=1 Tax=Fictibacillus fluitans TaxID=3058422 RepID=A0ABT8I2Z5_9BACL|nr:helix-turn-helix domain-containing protein [Fictibacillus sp. NE201]MDN4527398.1 AraC family transcriptional regulator [Fictibacillus sp. NE201]
MSSFFEFTVPPLPHYLYCGEDIYSGNTSHPNRKNIEVFDLLVVTRGNLKMAEEDQQWSVDAGQALILRPDRHHYQYEKCKDETHFYWLHFQTRGAWSENKENKERSGNVQITPFHQKELFYINIPRFCSLSNPISVYEKINNLLLLIKQPSCNTKLHEQAVFHELLQDLQTEQKPNINSTILQLAERTAVYLQKNYESAITYSTISEELNFHAAYLTRCMKKVYGCTPLDYLTTHRINQAKLILLNTDMSIGDIAEKVGFSSTSYFTRCFLKMVKISPLKFRKRFRT